MHLDGFTSHVNVESPVHIGNTSHVNQPYDQSVAKADKACIGELLDKVRHSLGVITQWDLIALCGKALKKVNATAWTDSFKIVNLHPDFCVSFVEWLCLIDGSIQTGKRFFVARDQGLFKAMPALWKNL